MRTVCFILVIVSLCSCTVIRQARENKKDAKAVLRVLSKPVLIDSVYKFALRLHPVRTDIIYVKGKDSLIYQTDSIPYPVDVIKEYKDTLVIIRKQTLVRVDTLKIPDTSRVRQLDLLTYQYSLLQGKNEQLVIDSKTLKQEVKDAVKSKKQWKWFFWGLVALIIISGAGYFILKLKKP